MLILNGQLGDAPDAGVLALQQSLAALAVAAGRPDVNPGPATGLLTPQTMLALAAGFDVFSSKLPWYAHYPLEAALLIGASSSAAMTAVRSYAPELAVAALAASKEVTPGYQLGPFTIPVNWYSTPQGIALIVLAVFVGYKLLHKKVS